MTFAASSKLVECSASPHTSLKSRAQRRHCNRRAHRPTCCYLDSQHIRKRVEEIFGWGKAVGNFRKTRLVGLGKNKLAGFMVAAAENLVRSPSLYPSLSRRRPAIGAGPSARGHRRWPGRTRVGASTSCWTPFNSASNPVSQHLLKPRRWENGATLWRSRVRKLLAESFTAAGGEREVRFNNKIMAGLKELHGGSVIREVAANVYSENQARDESRESDIVLPDKMLRDEMKVSLMTAGGASVPFKVCISDDARKFFRTVQPRE